MNKQRLSNGPLCRALMQAIAASVDGSARRYVDYLRHGPKSRVDEDMGRHILALATARLSDEQMDELEAAFRQIQEELLGWLFSVIDGGTQPPGFPDEIRLVNMDSGEVICPEGLEWAFGGAIAQWRSQSRDRATSAPEGE